MTEYIKREELMEFPIRRNHYDRENGNKHFINGIETVLEYAENLPAVDVAPVVHGRWIEGKDYLKCSVCRGLTKKDFRDGCWNYCPNCGAKMDGKTGDK